jgi:hypothetical protein
MSETARLTRTNPELRSTRQSGSRNLLVFVLTVGLAWSGCYSMFLIGSVGSTVQAQPAESSRLEPRAKIKSAAEKLNDIASAAPDMIRAMFAGNATSASLLALDEKSMAACKLNLKGRFSLRRRAGR